MKKIIFLVTQSEFGGAQRYIFELVSRLNPEKVDEDKSSSPPFAAARVYDILIAAGQGDKELFKKVQNLSIKTLQLKHLKRNPNPVKAVFSISEILDLLRKEKPDTLFLCSTTAGILGSISSFLYKKLNTNKMRVIYRIGGWAFNDPRNWFLNKFIFWGEKLTAPFKNKIIVNSEFDYRAAIKNKICSPDKIVRIYNGINLEKLNFLSKQQAKEFLTQHTKYNIQNTRYIVGAVANFYKTKGINLLIEAMRLLEAEHKPLGVKCIVIGDGKQRPELEKLIKKHNLKNKVFLVGRISDAYKYLKAFDVFILPSLKEGFPWIILEAMSAEIPIIATRVGALPEIIEDNKHGVLVEPKNSRILADKIFWFLNHTQEARNMGFQAGQKIKKEFSLKKMVAETEKILTNHSKVH
jgi:glycosyltransferase involved in cell wall biosynthesis